MEDSSADRAGIGVPLIVLLAGLLLMVLVGPRPKPPVRSAIGAGVELLTEGGWRSPGDEVRFGAPAEGTILIASGPDGDFVPLPDGRFKLPMEDRMEAGRILSTPISLNWRHPLNGLPVAQVFRTALRTADGVLQGEHIHTFLQRGHGALPIASLVLPRGALFDPDTGLIVVGNGIFRAPAKVLLAEQRDPRWWKYPGNFHMRGKDWERRGSLQVLDSAGREIFQREVDVRMNGQMTRAFPQHAFRLGFDPPLLVDLFGEPVGKGYEGLVLRAAGNDQIKAMMRDVFQHALCTGLPFEVSGHRTCVLYVNGAYWGVHHLRPRMDGVELARRYGIKKKHVTILEDEARLFHGDTALVVDFEHIAARCRAWDGKDSLWAKELEARVDIDGFLTYMATQMILANVDWPNQNVRFWRYTGPPRTDRPLDGRWYFIMGDSDLGYGVHAGPETDLFQRVRAMDVPVTRIFLGLLRSPKYKERFIAVTRELATGPLGARRSVALLDELAARLRPEMERHTARWRRPATLAEWEGHVALMRNFAAKREKAVLEQLKRL